MSAPFAVEWRGLVFGAVLAGAGLYALVRAGHAARRNRGLVDGAARRAGWRTPTSPARIRIAGALALAGGLALILFASPISIFHWS